MAESNKVVLLPFGHYTPEANVQGSFQIRTTDGEGTAHIETALGGFDVRLPPEVSLAIIELIAETEEGPRSA